MSFSPRGTRVGHASANGMGPSADGESRVSAMGPPGAGPLLVNSRGHRAAAEPAGLREVVYCIDVGMVRVGPRGGLRDTSFAWGRAPMIQDAPWCSYISLESLRGFLLADLLAGRRVALGIEAPMWIPLVGAVAQPGVAWDLFGPRFAAEAKHEWYLQSGAQAAVRALQLAYLALQPAAVDQDLEVQLTTHLGEWRDQQVHGTPILVWEAFVVSEFKPDYAAFQRGFAAAGEHSKDLIDAWRAAELFAAVLAAPAIPEVDETEGPLLSGPDIVDEAPNRAISTWVQVAQELGVRQNCGGRCYTVGAPCCARQPPRLPA